MDRTEHSPDRAKTRQRRNLGGPRPALLASNLWVQTHAADARAREIFERHYSCQNFVQPGRTKRFVGPGESITLVTDIYDALFVWRKFIDNAGHQNGINCAVFRNESDHLSSQLILEAEQWALWRWGPARLYTYVDPNKILSTNPGYCFLKAGYQRCGISKRRKYVILEKLLYLKDW